MNTQELRIIVSGTNGFVGRNLCPYLIKKNHKIIALSSLRSNNDLTVKEFLNDSNKEVISNFMPNCFIHLAGIAHESAINKSTESLIREVNGELPLKLVKKCNDYGINKFIFLSTIGVHGSSSTQVINESSPIVLNNIYSATKYHAEQSLKSYFNELKSTNIFIIRPSLIYGKNAKGNINKLQKLIYSGLPLPFKSINNKRSLLSIDNLNSALNTILQNDATSHETFVLADKELISTTDLIKIMGISSNVESRLFNFPLYLWNFGSRLPYISKSIRSLTEDYIVDSSKFRNTYSWDQKLSQKEALHKSFS